MRQYMRLILPFLCFLAIGPFAPGQGLTEDSEETYEGSYVRRPTLVVSNMDASLVLYRDILGFKVGRLFKDDADSYVYEAFNIPANTDVVHTTLDSDTEQRTISLVEVKDSKKPTSSDGIRHLAILMNANGRFDEIKSMLEDQNFQLLKTHPLGENGVEMGFLDPDGHLIVLYEIRRP